VDVCITGIGLTKFGKHPERNSRELFAEAALKAIEGSNISRKAIESVYIGNFSSDVFEGQCHLAPAAADVLGICPAPSIRVENACASGGIALRLGVMAIRAGFFDVVLVGGMEKMTKLKTSQVQDALAMASDKEYEIPAGITFPGMFATMATAHMNKYGTTEEQLAAVAVKNHKNAVHNPYAQFQKEISLEKALNAPMVAYPLKLYDCSPISDGAAAMVLMRGDLARTYTDTPIEIVGSGQGSSTMALHDRWDMTTIDGAIEARKQAMSQANLDPKEVDVCEVHDCFTIAEIIATEDLGFFKPGEGGPAAEEGRTALNGDISINTSGGLKAKGHPIGASGIGQAIEITLQLRGEAGKRQVDGPEIGMTHNVGGSGSSAVVHLYKRY
jgi:acetyl-CoA C-acetyltransferase